MSDADIEWLSDARDVWYSCRSRKSYAVVRFCSRSSQVSVTLDEVFVVVVL